MGALNSDITAALAVLVLMVTDHRKEPRLRQGWDRVAKVAIVAESPCS